MSVKVIMKKITIQNEIKQIIPLSYKLQKLFLKFSNFKMNNKNLSPTNFKNI